MNKLNDQSIINQSINNKLNDQSIINQSINNKPINQ